MTLPYQRGARKWSGIAGVLLGTCLTIGGIALGLVTITKRSERMRASPQEVCDKACAANRLDEPVVPDVVELKVDLEP